MFWSNRSPLEVRTDGDEQRVDSGRVVHPLLLTQMMQTDNLHPQLLSYKPILAASEDSTSTASGDSTSTESSGPSGSVFAVLCFELGFLWTAPHIGSFYQIWLKKMSKYFRNSHKIYLEFDWKCQQPMSSC